MDYRDTMDLHLTLTLSRFDELLCVQKTFCVDRRRTVDYLTGGLDDYVVVAICEWTKRVLPTWDIEDIAWPDLP